MSAVLERVRAPLRLVEGSLFWATLVHPCFGMRTVWTEEEHLFPGKRVELVYAGRNGYGTRFARLARPRYDSGCIPVTEEYVKNLSYDPLRW